ncbi:leucyl/phenylalanyl-tRNA--protein transferase [uncultured Desulfovibrio sp.]|uniref:leucyl/phenylalanyl-tRNA--protein transferase n=1 Tax=uncultured Desulfovibrio sp. TaxID=167968 RepID=UPI0003A103A3|nr:leucyl/phenylalanyl-tRNA--protein transferase [uncultured Desulfovibrio sp.]
MRGVFAELAAQFPPPKAARADGLLCAGGDLRPERLLAAYSRGIFPWYEEGLPILWWSPDPRCVLPLESFRLPSRSARALRRHSFDLTLDAAFGLVIRACAGPRTAGNGTWLTPEMIAAYERLHALGYAHSVEAWRDGSLAGGLYGVALGRAFFGESMFHRASEASRAALAGLVALLRLRGAELLDCQQQTPHIMRMGGVMLPRASFLDRLARALAADETGEPVGRRMENVPWAPWKTGYAYSAISGSWTARS